VRQFADYYIGRTQGSDQGLIQIAGRGGLTFRQSLKPLAGVPSASYGRHSQDISQDILPSNHHSRIEIKVPDVAIRARRSRPALWRTGYRYKMSCADPNCPPSRRSTELGKILISGRNSCEPKTAILSDC
jgi:hypothetical protein